MSQFKFSSRWLHIGWLCLLFACDQTGEINQPCPAKCPSGTKCNTSTGQCDPLESDQNYNSETCNYPNTQCGTACVNTLEDVENCGGCGNRCGPNTICSASQCNCKSGYDNCNGNWFDGCECQGGCNDKQCKTQAADQCDVTSPGSCGSVGKFCSAERRCDECPTGWQNCDQKTGCDCNGQCDGATCTGSVTQCDPTKANDCGDSDSFCDTASRECMKCTDGKKNCDGKYGCDCPGTCSGDQCVEKTQQGNQCDPKAANACGDSSHYCNTSTGQCDTCANGTMNCDGIDDCESSSCQSQTQSCDANDPVSCGASSDKYCDSGTCKGCSAGYFNCDGKGSNGCECQEGCDGTACKAGSTNTCTASLLWGCGNDSSKYCDGSQCKGCDTGTYNCNGISGDGCECSNGCEGTSCKSSTTTGCNASASWSCGTTTAKYCQGSQCLSCSGGTYNCDGVNSNGCECSNGCDGTQCKASSSGPTFNDVSSSHPFYTDILWVAGQKIMVGCQTSPPNFCPNDITTRAQAAVALVKMQYGDSFSYSSINPFSDVPSTHWAFKYVQKLKQDNITAGCGGNKFCPDIPLKRVEAATFLIKYLKGDFFSYSSSNPFSDVPSTHWAFKYVQKVRQDGISSGCGGNKFCPDSSITRGELASFIYKGKH